VTPGLRGTRDQAEATAPSAAGPGTGAPAMATPGTGSPGSPRPGRSPRRRATVAVAVTVAGAVAAAAAIIATRYRGPVNQAAATAPPTAVIQRTSLTNSQQINGTLGYAASYRVIASGTARGTVTWLPQEGQVITRGEQAFGVDGREIPLFYGPVPLWRPLEAGVAAGPDVLELEQNLAALGFGAGMTVSDQFTGATAGAVAAWQGSLGLPETGIISPGDVVIEPGPIRVSSVSATLGGPAASVLYTASGTQRVVTVNVPVDQEQLARQGVPVTVQLPGGVTATGHVSQVGTVAQAGSQGSTAGVSQSQQGDQALQNATIQVQVSLDHPAAAGSLDGAPAIVNFTSQAVHGVLAVPVTALLAKPDGSYAVEVVAAAGHRSVVPVQLGLFAGGNVQISGRGLREGMRVEVPGQ
jgi:peptidoglycan hydrolase-like protein with peptidoglycan-binding domain